MRQILDSGVTGILVSHSLGQVRELCNKILWIDHGKQVGFSSDVKMMCDAYEEFLIDKKLPKSMEDIKNDAIAFRKRKASQQTEKVMSETERILDILRKSNVANAKEAVSRFLKDHNK